MHGTLDAGLPSPVAGKRIVVTRPRAQADAFVEALERRGAEVVALPTIRIERVPEREPLLRAAREVDTFDWLVFTSINGVAHFWTALREVGRDTRSLAGVSVCAIGPATAAALELEGVRPDLVPTRYVAEAVVEALAEEVELRGTRILLPRAKVARPVLPDALRARGAEVVEVAAYVTRAETAEAATLRRRVVGGEVDLITFTASSTVHGFADLMGSAAREVKAAAIGPITAATARERGFDVVVEAEEYTVPGLLRAIEEYYASGGG